MHSQRASRSAHVRQQRSQRNAAQGLGKLSGELRNSIFQLVIPSDLKLDTSKRVTAEESEKARRVAANQFALDRRCDREYWTGKVNNNVKRATFYKADVAHYLRTNHSGTISFVPAITQVCSALRQETSNFFYGNNTFELRTSGDMKYEAVEQWLSSCSQVSLEAMRQIVVSYVQKGGKDYESYSLQLKLNLATGAVEALALPDYKGRLFGFDYFPVAEKRAFALLGNVDWAVDSVGPFGGWTGCGPRDITVPARALAERSEEVKLLHGFGDDKQEMTRERLMGIMEAFNFYKKDFCASRPTGNVDEYIGGLGTSSLNHGVPLSDTPGLQDIAFGIRAVVANTLNSAPSNARSISLAGDPGQGKSRLSSAMNPLFWGLCAHTALRKIDWHTRGMFGRGICVLT